MAFFETIAAKSLSEKVLHRALQAFVGSFATLWLGFIIFGNIADPTTIIAHVGDYLGFIGTDKKIAPADAWIADPRRHSLFICAAAVAGVLFNIGSARILPIHSAAPSLAWALFLSAVQGVGLLSATITCMEVTAIIIAFTLSMQENRRGWRRVLGTIWTNILENMFILLFPCAIILLWSIAAYNSEMPARELSKDSKSAGVAPVSSSPFRRGQY